LHPRAGPRCVNEGKDREAEPGRMLHQALRLAKPFRLRLRKVAGDVLFRRPPLLVPDHYHSTEYRVPSTESKASWLRRRRVLLRIQAPGGDPGFISLDCHKGGI